MSLNNFCIKKNEGVNFAKYSGDNNSIHTDEIYGYNSIYGQNIVHGVLLILKFLITKKFKKNLSYIKVLFKEGTKYNHKIDIKKLKTSKEKILYELMQLNNIIAKIEIGFFPSNYQIQNLEKLSFQKEYFVKKKKIK